MSDAFWAGKRVCVTGGAGFIGSYLTELVVDAGAQVTVADTLERGTLDRLASVRDRIKVLQVDVGTSDGAHAAADGQDVVLNLAAKVTGIEYNRFHNADMFTANMRIVSSVLEAAASARVGRVLTVSTACIYPHDALVPTPETEGARGTPEPTNEGYGWAKRMAEELSRYYANETGLDVVVCRPFNAYGPRDHWDEATSHVIPALVKRVLDREDPVVVWGSGNQTRAFLHARDAAKGMALIAEHANGSDPINIGHDTEISMRDLVEIIIGMTGSSTRVTFDTSKPDGYPRRAADVTKLLATTGWVPDTPLQTGLAEMIDEYRRLSGVGAGSREI